MMDNTDNDGKGPENASGSHDLYVLDTQQEPINDFIQHINHHGINFPVSDFIQGIFNIPWLDLMDEFEQLEILPPYEKITAYDAKRHFDSILSRLSILDTDDHMADNMQS